MEVHIKSPVEKVVIDAKIVEWGGVQVCPGEPAGVSHGHWDDLEILISCGPAESNVKGFVGLCLKSTFLSCVSISKVYFLHVYFF